MFVPVKSSRVVVVSFVVAACGIAYLATRLTTVSLDYKHPTFSAAQALSEIIFMVLEHYINDLVELDVSGRPFLQVWSQMNLERST